MNATSLPIPLTVAAPSAVVIPAGAVLLPGELVVPARAVGVVLFAHGSGSSRLSPRNQSVARALRESGIGTLLFDLLTSEEAEADAGGGSVRVALGQLTGRLMAATLWARQQPETAHLGVGYFGSSTGSAAALCAAATLGAAIDAVVSRGGRPDLAPTALAKVIAPTLLLVGENDAAVRVINERALRTLNCPKRLTVVPRASHLFAEPGALEEVARQAAQWFGRYLRLRAEPRSVPESAGGADGCKRTGVGRLAARRPTSGRFTTGRAGAGPTSSA